MSKANGLTHWLETHITLHTYDDPRSERANSLTHIVGTALALIAFIAILFKLPTLSTLSLKIGMVVWGLTMILLYSASALYHALPYGNAKRVCRILDHSNIYFLIAGTYTPLLLYVNTPTSHLLAYLVWAIALSGILFTLVFWGKLRALHVILYLGMGWLIVFFWKDIIPFLPSGLLVWVISAGLTYSIGVIFYANKRIPHYHAIWHLFCIGGSALFFVGYMITLS
ncbi:MAG: hemolysin III family protein [Sphaerochaeta sp.]|uniref:PAQR family membrane homeostasis protein TrhA n=1 Tax=Sphaerochaeta sp. TaxID=1972642 RepID=UPI002FC5CEC4